MARVYGFNVAPGSALFATELDWESQMTVDATKAYLKDHLRTQLTREIPPATDAFIAKYKKDGLGVGFYALTRMIFAPITFLGCLYRGSDSTDHAVDFLEEYAGRKFNSRYLDLAAAIFVMYRHGLTHTSMPKIIERDDGQAVGWKLTLDAVGSHLSVEKGKEITVIVVSLEQLFADTVRALDNYIADFDGPGRAGLLASFKLGYLTMARIERIDALHLSKTMKLRLRKSLDPL